MTTMQMIRKIKADLRSRTPLEFKPEKETVDDTASSLKWAEGNLDTKWDFPGKSKKESLVHSFAQSDPIHGSLGEPAIKLKDLTPEQ